MIKIAICDDASIFTDNLEKMLQEFERKSGEPLDIQKYTKPLHLVDSLEKGFQIFFLDIEMPNMNGVELATTIRKYDQRCIIVFVTSFKNYYPAGYDVNAFDYIEKPITQIQVDCEMKKAVRKISNQLSDEYVILKKYKETVKVYLADIYYIEKANRHAVFHYKIDKGDEIEEAMMAGRQTLQKLEDRLCIDIYPFFRCHNGFIVNINCIQNMCADMLELSSGARIPVVRTKRSSLLEKVAESEEGIWR